MLKSAGTENTRKDALVFFEFLFKELWGQAPGRNFSVFFRAVSGFGVLNPCGWEGWDAVDLGNCPKSESSRKWSAEGAKGLLDPASKRPLALVRNGVAPVQKRVWVMQKTLGRPLLPGPKRSPERPFAPSPNHF